MASTTETPRRSSPLGQLILARLREFYREPAAIFWVYGFPILMVIALGVAFRTKPVERVTVDIVDGPMASKARDGLVHQGRPGELEFVIHVHDAATCRQRLRTGKTDLVVAAGTDSTSATFQYTLDKSRAESRLARTAVHEALQRAAGRTDPVPAQPDEEMTEPGSRYVDYLVPGLLGMNLMGGGLWGVGFVIVEMRLRKLLKRYLATPMRRSDFLIGIMCSRLIFMVPEVLVLLLFARLSFGVVIYGSLFSVLVLVLAGAFCFAGIGLLIASRAKTIETVSGLMNLVMLPMWLLSGIFFSPDRFPDALQPLIKALPLTPLIEALRAVMLEGASLDTQLWRIAICIGWGALSFVLALKWFRWN
jgi:ABC-type multidrug transport system permease subunit